MSFIISEIFCGKSHSCAYSGHKRGYTDSTPRVYPTAWSVLHQVPAAAAPGVPYQGEQAGCIRQTRHYGCVSVSIGSTILGYWMYYVCLFVFEGRILNYCESVSQFVFNYEGIRCILKRHNYSSYSLDYSTLAKPTNGDKK